MPADGERDGIRFLVVFACLVVLVECVAGAIIPRQLGRHEVDRRTADVAKTVNPPRVVFLSDSVSYEALGGADESVGVLDLSSNQVIGVPGNLFMLQRLLDSLGPDSAEIQRVVYAITPYSLDENVDATKYMAAYFTSVFQEPREIELIQDVLGREDLASGMREGRRFRWLEPPLAKRSGVVRDPLGLVLRDIKVRQRRGGGIPQELTQQAQDFIDRYAARTKVNASQATALFLPRLAQLCAERGIDLRVVTAPTAPSVSAAWADNGFAEDFDRFRSDILDANPGMSWIHPCPYSPPSDAAFYDGSHLVQDAKDEWGQVLQTLL